MAHTSPRKEGKKKNTLFICNPLDCSSPNGRTLCRCSILSLAHLGRGCPKDRRGAKILQSFTAPSYSLAINGITAAEFSADLQPLLARAKDNGAGLLHSTNTAIAE